MLRDANFKSFNGIYVICGYTDMRYGIDSLASIIEQRYNMSIFIPNTLFLFCGRRANKIKGLVWEGDGFLLLSKRIDSGGRFSWPRNSNEAKKLTAQQFKWLMYGFSIEPVIKTVHPEKSA